jgi:hypothetical protein
MNPSPTSSAFLAPSVYAFACSDFTAMKQVVVFPSYFDVFSLGARRALSFFARLDASENRSLNFTLHRVAGFVAIL